jgi:uncharacterized protein (DUF934 family)
MPKLLKDNGIIEDSWRLITGEEQAEAGTGNVLLPLGQWLARDDEERKSETCAPWISAEDEIEECLDKLLSAPLIAIDFPTFMDGRGFSTAEILRKEGYRGELRAIGYLIQDQLYFLKRCGFDSVCLREGTDLEKALKSFQDFSVTYQTSADTEIPLFRRR